MNHLTNVNLFKQLDYPSWSFSQYGDMGITIKKDNQATNWDKYFKANVQAGLEGTGYIIHRYKRGNGIKKTVVGKTFGNYLNAKDKKYYGMTGKKFANFAQDDLGYQNALKINNKNKSMEAA